jgi:hypothetical protein
MTSHPPPLPFSAELFQQRKHSLVVTSNVSVKRTRMVEDGDNKMDDVVMNNNKQQQLVAIATQQQHQPQIPQFIPMEMDNNQQDQHHQQDNSYSGWSDIY